MYHFNYCKVSKIINLQMDLASKTNGKSKLDKTYAGL